MPARHHGFTLIEMVVVIVISAIVVGFLAMFLVTPVNSYMSQKRRVEMSDSASNAMRMIEEDVRHALPGSVRVIAAGTNRTMELLSAEVARYHQGMAVVADLNKTGDNEFTALGCFNDNTVQVSNTTQFLVVGNGLSGGNVYTRAGVTSPFGALVTVDPCIAGEQRVRLNASFAYNNESPTGTVYLVSEPVAYVCNLTTGTIKRFWNYQTNSNQAAVATEAQLLLNGASSALVAQYATNCIFNTTPEGQYLGGLARVRMTFTRNNETFQAFDQVQVENRR